MNTAAILCTLVLCGGSSVPPGDAPLRLVQTIPLPGVEGRIDHMAVDVKGGRLFICALGNNTLEVVDLNRGQRAVSLKGFHEPQGCAYLPEFDLIAVANGQSARMADRLTYRTSFSKFWLDLHGASVAFVDGKTYRENSEELGLDDADNLRYDPPRERLYVGYGNGAIAAMHPLHGKLNRGETNLPGHPESFQIHGEDIYVNVPSVRRIYVVHHTTYPAPISAPTKTVHYWNVIGAEANFPMTIVAGKYVCIGCRKPPKLQFYEIPSGKLAGECAIPGDTDDVFVDRKTMRLYASCGEGYIAVVSGDVTSGLHVTKVSTAPGARTSLFVPELNRLYLAVPHRGRQRAEIRVYEPQP